MDMYPWFSEEAPMKLQMIILDARFICKKKKGENNDFNIKGLINIQNAMEEEKLIHFQTNLQFLVSHLFL